MSTIKMQESIPDELAQLRRRATEKDVHYATLENELLKKNNDLLAVKKSLDDALYKLRNEADRALKLESDLNRRIEDLQAERLTRQNLETSLRSAQDKLRTEELNSKHLEMELETYALRTASEHEGELKQLQREKTILEGRVRSLVSQSQMNNTPQPTSHLPRSTTSPDMASSYAPDPRTASLEVELSKARQELSTMSCALSGMQQEAAKLPHLQSKLIAAENAQLRAERLAAAEKTRADGVQDALIEREEELEYLRSLVADRSSDEAQIEDLARERDDAIKREYEIRWRESALKKRLEEMEERESRLATEKEEALDALHRLQVESKSSPLGGEDGVTLDSLQAALAERETALEDARKYATQLQQMYHDTLGTCEAAEARVRDLERQDTKDNDSDTPLIIVSPPPTPSSDAPFLAQPPAKLMFPGDEAAVAKLLTAVERLRSERDSLRRDFHFAQVEHKISIDFFQQQLATLPREARGETEGSHASEEEINNAERLKSDLQSLQRKINSADVALKARTTELEACNARLESVRLQLQTQTTGTGHATTSHVKVARVALASLILVDHLRTKLDRLEISNDASLFARERSMYASDSAVGQGEPGHAVSPQISLHAGFPPTDALHETRDIQIADMEIQLSALQTTCSALERELADTRAELSTAEARFSEHNLSTLGEIDVQAAEALRTEIEILEQRVLRRTEQIGMQQHDIKRLETNLRVAEETIGELNAEVETLAQEKEFLVEDCGQAREARDKAHKKLEALEIEVETLTKEHEELVALRTTYSQAKEALDEAHRKIEALEVQVEASGEEHTEILELRRTSLDAETEVAASEGRVEALLHVIADSMSRSRGLNAELIHTKGRLSTEESALREIKASLRQGQVEVERLTSELESRDSMLRTKVADIQAISNELSLANDKARRLSDAFDSYKEDVQSHEEDVSGKTDQLITTVQELEARLASEQESQAALSGELESLKHAETTYAEELREARAESTAAAAEVDRLLSTVKSLEEAIESDRVVYSEDFEQAQKTFETRLKELESQLEERRIQHVVLEEDHAKVVRDLTTKSEGLQRSLAEASAKAVDEHAEEFRALRSRLSESVGRVEGLEMQLKTATETIKEFESETEASVQRYEAAQVEIRGLEHALNNTRAQLDDHDTSIQALQREKTLLQAEHTRLDAELEKSTTKYQYLEQHSRRSDQEIMRLKAEIDHLRAEAAKLDESAQKAQVNLSLKTVQFEKKLAVMDRELKKQQDHRHCQDNVAELKERNEYLEEMLRMKSVEIEENDDRFIEALKEKKRLNGKIDSLTRKVQSLQAKLTAVTTQQPSATPEPKTPSLRLPSVPPLLPSSIRSGSRIPSSPAEAIRAKTPEPSRSLIPSRFATPEPPVPALPQAFRLKTPERQMVPRPANHERSRLTHSTFVPNAPSAPSTPLSSGSRKRRVPDDFDPPAPIPAEAIVATPGIDATPRHVRQPSADRRSIFPPTRNGQTSPARSAVPQASPLRRLIAPLSESTNSPRLGKVLGSGKPTATLKPSTRGWLSRSRPAVGDPRHANTVGPHH